MPSSSDSSPANLIPISAATLFAGEGSGFKIFVRANSSEMPLLFCSENQPLTSEMLSAIDGHSRLFIEREDREAYQEYLRRDYQKRLADTDIPVMNRVSLLSEVIRDILSNQFATGNTESIVESCQLLGKESAALLGSEQIVPHELCHVLHHDFGTFTHSANVSAYAVVLARALGFSSLELEQIAVGGLIHDIGKLDVSDQILNKPGKLTDAEFNQVRKHPVTGLQRVGNRTDLVFGQLMMVYQHHERLNGTGYPVGCDESEIHPWSKVCAIVDVFEALTSQRPYRLPFTNATAFAVLERGSGTEFDKEMLTCWRKLLEV